MEDPIETKAYRLLAIMVERNLRECGNDELQQLSGMEDGFDVNDALEWLEERHAIEVEWIRSVDSSLAGGLVTLRSKGKSMYNQRQQADGAGRQQSVAQVDSRAVFIVHGRDIRIRDAMSAFLRAIDLRPLEWNEVVQATGKGTPYIGEILDKGFALAHAVVVLLTPDDEARLRDQCRRRDDPPYEAELTPQARPNVLYEAGMAMGKHPERTILVEFGRLRPFTDVGGMHTIRMDNSTAKRQDLAQRLRTAGCAVNIEGTGWHAAGEFPTGDA